MTSLQRKSPLWDQPLPVHVQSDDGTVANRSIIFRVLRGESALEAAGQREQVIHLEVNFMFHSASL